MTAPVIRGATPGDRESIAALVERAFGQKDEAVLVDRLVADGDVVLELVAESDGRIVGHILFSRLIVEDGDSRFAAVALAPLAVEPEFQKTGVGRPLVGAAHGSLRAAGESLSVVVGDPAYYGRFGYAHDRAALFASDYQGEAMQALAWRAAPIRGRLVYAPAFAELG
jgi:putative acetyltransferase